MKDNEQCPVYSLHTEHLIETMKRQGSGIEPISRKRFGGLDRKVTSQYNGYVPSSPNTEIDTIDLPRTKEEINYFFETYVVPRRPCRVNGISPSGFPVEQLQPRNIVDFLPRNEILTIEKKSEGGFGSGAKRMKMSFGEFMEKLMDEGERGLYLTTQYYEDDPTNSDYSTDEDEKDQVLDADDDFETGSLTFGDLRDDFDELEQDAYEEEDDDEDQEIRIRELYQPPMTNLVKTLPECPDFLKYLIPQQINLWIGAAAQGNAKDDEWLAKYNADDVHGKLGLGRNIPGGGSSSGLHHDHADNIYIPVSGYKRFTLFSPADAAKMYTVGTIRQIFSSGVIDYVADDHAPLWRQLRDDGAIVAEVYKKTLDSDATVDPKLKKKYEEFIELDAEQQQQKQLKDLDPPSFSTIPPTVIHLDKIQDATLKDSITQASRRVWPLFFQAQRITVDLKPGQMLYLPTGWFHEVTSFGGDVRDNVHVAANYWFIPPTGNDIHDVYPNDDRYWPDDFEVTERALDTVRGREGGS